ncbi:MAG: hypothetical protein AB8H79_16210 [Myxococcota bacterium]
MTVHGEVRALAAAQNLPNADVDACLRALEPHLDHYAELVVTHDGLEVITGGKGQATAIALAKVALDNGASQSVADLFLHLQARHPKVMLGLKVELGPQASSPTLYVRTQSAVDRTLDALAEHVAVPAALRQALAHHRVLYGLGLHDEDGELQVKTYTVDTVQMNGQECDGFVSWRLRAGVLTPEVKHYLPEVPWREISGDGDRWARLLKVGQELGFAKAGHVAITQVDGRPTALKLYIERVGAVPTDWSAR